MPIEMLNTTIYVEDPFELELVAEKLENELSEYSRKYNDFSCSIEKYVDDGKIIIKSVYLQEHCN